MTQIPESQTETLATLKKKRVETALTEWKAASAAVRNIEWGWAAWKATREAESKAATRLAEAVSEAWPHWSPWVARMAAIKPPGAPRVQLNVSAEALTKLADSMAYSNAKGYAEREAKAKAKAAAADPGNGKTP